jgi:hypothetical protein
MMAKNADNLIYVANFTNDNGFAILAADDRIKEKVIAVTDKSNLTQADVDAVASFFKNNETYTDPDYPTTGNGLFTVKDYPDEVFLNPNTFSTYDEKEEDYWVGNFSDDDDSTLNTRAMAHFENDRRMALSYCTRYALRELTVDGDGGGGGGCSDTYTTNTTYSDWTDVQRTNNLLSAYTGWYQGTPFNDLYPHRREYILFGHRKKAPAGCFPLSLAKILTNFKKPKTFSYNGTIVDWNALNNVYSYQGEIAAATLLRGIAEWCGSMYFYKGTFTFPSKASSFLKDMGFNDVKRFNYTYNRVTCMIDNSCPVIIYAVPGIKIWDSHAWIIDGYKIKVRQKITRQYRNGNLISTSTEPETCRMVHCDFGWGGRCNGYYVDGVFKLNSSDNDYDEINTERKNTKYNHHVRIITYAKPV